MNEKWRGYYEGMTRPARSCYSGGTPAAFRQWLPLKNCNSGYKPGIGQTWCDKFGVGGASHHKPIESGEKVYSTTGFGDGKGHQKESHHIGGLPLH